MGYSRFCYSTKFKFFPADLSRESDVTFYRPDPAALVLEDRTKFSTAIGLECQGPGAGNYLGEQRNVPRAWYNGASLEPYDGSSGCASPSTWFVGSTGPGADFDKSGCCGDRFAFSFGGGTNKIIASDTGLPSGTSARSIAFWIKPGSLANDQSIIFWGTFAAKKSNTISTGLSYIGLQFTGDGGFRTSSIMVLNTWQHYVFTLDGNNTLTSGKAYFNGVDQTVATLTVLPSTVLNGSLYLGNHPAGAPAQCVLDDVRIYDYVLSQSQIDFIFSSGHGTTLPAPGNAPLGWYKFNEGSAPAIDSGSLAHNATTTTGTYVAGGVPFA